MVDCLTDCRDSSRCDCIVSDLVGYVVSPNTRCNPYLKEQYRRSGDPTPFVSSPTVRVCASHHFPRYGVGEVFSRCEELCPPRTSDVERPIRYTRNRKTVKVAYPSLVFLYIWLLLFGVNRCLRVFFGGSPRWRINGCDGRWCRG